MPGDSGLMEAIGLGRRRPDGSGWLLREVGLRIEPGERVALVGPTGSGKTLLLRALALLDPIDTGEVLWCGRTIRGVSVPSFRRRVIYLHQRPALFEGTVEENLRLPYSLKGWNPGTFDRARVVDFLAELGRDGSFLARSHRDLSGGEAQGHGSWVRGVLAASIPRCCSSTSRRPRSTPSRPERPSACWNVGEKNSLQAGRSCGSASTRNSAAPGLPTAV